MTQPASEGRLEKRKRERRLRIYNVAMDLFHRQGFEQTTESTHLRNAALLVVIKDP